MINSVFRMRPLLALLAFSLTGIAFVEAADSTLPRSTPEAQGISTTAIRKFIAAADEQIDTLHSFMLVRHGHVIAEAWWKPESPDQRHIMWSLSKSFCSTAVGIAADEGKLSLDDPVLQFFPEQAPKEPNEHLQAMRVRDLLTMSGGHKTQPKFNLEAGPTVKGFLSHPVTEEPGTWFRYNTPGTYMLSAIVTKATGETVLDYLKPRLFDPLGIKNPRWDATAEGHSIGGYGLFVRTEDVAKLGLLYLQNGEWRGRQLLSKSWVENATRKQVDNSKGPHAKNPDWAQGYGYQFWRCRHDCYRGDGRDGQICLVIPQHDAVIAITAKTRQMQDQLNLVWEILLPAFESKPLPENKAERKRLKKVITALRAHPKE